MTVYNPLLAEGFGHGSLTWLTSYGWTTSGTVAISSAHSHTTVSGAGSAYSASLTNASTLTTPSFATTSRWAQAVTWVPSGSVMAMGFFRSGVANASVSIDTTGLVKIWRGLQGNTLLATSASSLPASTNQLLWVDMVAKEAVNGGRCQVYANASVTAIVDTGANVDCANTATPDWDQVRFQAYAGGSFFVMDVVVFTTTDGRFPGEMYSQWQYPTGNGVVTFTPSADTNWQCVDDAAVTTNYNSSLTANQDLLTYAPLGLTGITIITVAMQLYGTTEGSVTTSANVASSGGSTSSGTLRALSAGGTYSGLQDYFNADPSTGAAWTVPGLDAASFGYKVA